MVKDEQGSILLTSMVACLFARGVNTDVLPADGIGRRPMNDRAREKSKGI